MIELIVVDRADGRAVAGLLTSVLTHWDSVPLNVQASIIADASSSAFESVGRDDGHYVVTAFILKHRADLARKARARAAAAAAAKWRLGRFAEAPRQMVDAALASPIAKWLVSLKRAA